MEYFHATRYTSHTYTNACARVQLSVHPAACDPSCSARGGLLAVPTCNSLCITGSGAHVHFCESAQAESRRTRRVQPIACYARCIVPRSARGYTMFSLDRKYRDRASADIPGCDDARGFSPRYRPFLTDRSRILLRGRKKKNHRATTPVNIGRGTSARRRAFSHDVRKRARGINLYIDVSARP